MLQDGDPCGLASPFAKATEDKSEAALQGGDPSASHPPSPEATEDKSEAALHGWHRSACAGDDFSIGSALCLIIVRLNLM